MLAAVCCQGAAAVSLIDLATREPAGTVPVGGHPVHAAVASGRVFVATMDERAVSAVDVDGSVRSVSTGVLGPSHFAHAAGRLFVSCTGGDALAAIDPDALELDGRAHVGAEPHGLAVLDRQVYAGSRADGTVTVVDPESLEPRATVDAGDGARVQDLEASSEAVYAVDQAGERVLALDAGGVRASAPVGGDPYDVTVTDDAVYVPGRADGTVHAFDHDLERVAVHETGPGAAVVEPLAGERWVAHRGAPVLRALEGPSIDLPHPAYALEPVDEGRLLAAGYEDAAVTLVDVRERRVLGTFAVEANPLGMIVV